jgi:hypothetical protein
LDPRDKDRERMTKKRIQFLAEQWQDTEKVGGQDVGKPVFFGPSPYQSG